MSRATDSALAALSNAEKNFWDLVSDGVVTSSFVARRQFNDVLRNMSLEATTLNGFIEWRQGTDLSRLLQDESFRGIAQGRLPSASRGRMQRERHRRYQRAHNAANAIRRPRTRSAWRAPAWRRLSNVALWDKCRYPWDHDYDGADREPSSALLARHPRMS